MKPRVKIWFWVLFSLLVLFLCLSIFFMCSLSKLLDDISCFCFSLFFSCFFSFGRLSVDRFILWSFTNSLVCFSIYLPIYYICVCIEKNDPEIKCQRILFAFKITSYFKKKNKLEEMIYYKILQFKRIFSFENNKWKRRSSFASTIVERYKPAGLLDKPFLLEK